MQHIIKTYGYAFLFSLSGYIGIQYVLSLIREYGALVAVSVTTTRKAVSIILSFIIFSKPFTFDYVWSGLIVVIGIYLNVLSKTSNFSFITLFKNILIQKYLRKSEEKEKLFNSET